MYETKSSTKLEPVLVEPYGTRVSVWLRKNIRTIEDETVIGHPQTMWVADEVYGTLPAGATVAEVTANFDRLWRTFDKTEDERLADVEDVTQTLSDATEMLSDALAELSEVTSDESIDVAIVIDAVADMSEVVSDLATQVTSLVETIGG